MLHFNDMISENRVDQNLQKTQSKQQIFNTLLIKLQRRNASNQIFIKTFRKQMNRRYPNFSYEVFKVDHSISNSMQSQDDSQTNMKAITSCQEQKSMLVQTNHTIEVIHQLNKITSLPSINQIQMFGHHPKEEISKQSNKMNKLVNLGCTFFKEEKHKVKQSININSKNYQKPIRNSYQGISNSKKYHLNINSLVFGSQTTSKISNTKCKPDFKTIMKQRKQNQRTDHKTFKNTREFDDIQTKIILPMISNIQLSHKYQNSIRNTIGLNIEKQQRNRIQTDQRLSVNDQNLQKIALTYRINAIKLKRYA